MKLPHPFHRCLAAAITVLLTGCVVGPDYARPDVATQDHFKSANAEQDQPTALTPDWWTLYGDPTLNALEEEALAANQSIQAAMARVEQARATASGTRSAFYPSANLGASVSRSGSPEPATASTSAVQDATSAVNRANDVLSRLNALQSGDLLSALGGLDTGQDTSVTASNTNTTYRLPFDLSYELDFWGRIRRTSESAEAGITASEYALETVRQTVAADLAQNYFSLRALDRRTSILSDTLKTYDEQVQLTQSKFTAGLIGENDVLQARIQRQTTTAELAETQRQRANTEHAIAILLGKAPANFELSVEDSELVVPNVPAGLPGELLRRRPDVAEAEQNVVAANADVGAAIAERYPKFTITGGFGLESATSGQLLDASSFFWSIAPGVSLPLFDGGKIKANIRGAEARYNEQVALYRDVVLNAYVDAETALTDINRRAERALHLNAAVSDARELARLTRLQYDSGTTDYLSILNAEQTLLTNELAVVTANQDRLTASVLLIKALGGGWDGMATLRHPEAEPVPDPQS